MTLDLTDQVALVAGAGQGIGRASALAVAEAGAHVVVADIAAPLADATTGVITSTQRRALAVQADVGDLRILSAWSVKPWLHSGRSTSS
jgi:NAD(P)-dependent dehydrogenase (short-subunit alcohol dehydrogenase family)